MEGFGPQFQAAAESHGRHVDCSTRAAGDCAFHAIVVFMDLLAQGMLCRTKGLLIVVDEVDIGTSIYKRMYAIVYVAQLRPPVVSRCCGFLLFSAVAPFVATDGIDLKASFHTTGPFISWTHSWVPINCFCSSSSSPKPSCQTQGWIGNYTL